MIAMPKKHLNMSARYMNRIFIRFVIFLFLTISISGTSWGWHDKTHIAIAKAAGYKYWFNAAGADITKVKAGALEEKNHYFNNYNNVDVTYKMVLDQANRYNDPNDEEGHLYGAIISSLRDYRSSKLAGKYAEYYMAFAVHYIGDLSQPLHNVLYDNFNKTHHSINDGIVDDEVLDNIEKIQKYMYEIKLQPTNFDQDLSREIARIANISRILGLKMRAENRDMTREEAYTQLGHSASLLKAVLNSLGEIDK
jgi:hypothetical protein